MKAIVDWASEHARMVIALVLLSIAAGGLAYSSLPKEGEPDIDIPALFVSIPFPGISAEDSEKLIVKPLENELRDLDGLDRMTGSAAEGFAIVVLEFEFGWDKQAVIAEVRDRVNSAEADWPDGAEQYTIDEINFSEFPILIMSLSGELPERALLRVAEDLKSEIEGLGEVLEAPLAGHRDEMLEVLIDPLQLEAYNVTAGDLINVVVRNNQLVAAGEVESDTGAFAERRQCHHPRGFGGYSSHIRGPRWHRALQRREHHRGASGQAQRREYDRHRGAGKRGGCGPYRRMA